MEIPRIRLTESEYNLIINRRTSGGVLVIGDLHAPFTRKGYLEHCIRIRDEYKTSETVFIGDILDNHASSFHPSDADGWSAGDELQHAIETLQPWHREFPNAKVTLGNHDRVPARKAYESGVSSRWMLAYRHVLNTPSWDFVDHYIKDEVLYVHGDGAGKANMRARKELMSVVQGHFHSTCAIDWFVGRHYRIFSLQCGCGVDDTTYAMAYGKNHPRSILACAVVLDQGNLPIIEPMRL